MIFILSLKSSAFNALKASVYEINSSWKIVKLETYFLASIPLVRVALICDCDTLPEINTVKFATDAIIPETKYCVACLLLGEFTALNNRNSSGYCLEHRELDPKRKQDQHQRYKQRRSTNVQKIILPDS